MEEIKNAVYNNVELNNDQIIQAFQEIGASGNTVIFKNDGLRPEDKFTVVISSPTEKFSSIRRDDLSLSLALTNCLRKYFKEISGR
jgi:hypothetical protein